MKRWAGVVSTFGMALVLTIAGSPAFASRAMWVPQSSVVLAGGNPVAPAPVPMFPAGGERVSVPVVVIHPHYAYQPPRIPRLPATVKVMLSPSLAKACAAYYFPLGPTSYYIIAPRGMKSSAEVGMDGSYDVTLRGKAGEVDVSSTGACEGCAVDAAAMYFPAARAEARKYGAEYSYTQSIESMPVRWVRWNPHLCIWGYKVRDGRHLAGFAYYQPESAHHQVRFVQEVFVASGAEVQQLAPWMFQNTCVQLGFQTTRGS